jgi:hypothetical protein
MKQEKLQVRITIAENNDCNNNVMTKFHSKRNKTSIVQAVLLEQNKSERNLDKFYVSETDIEKPLNYLNMPI